MGQFQITSARGKQTRGRRRVDWGEEWEWDENNIAALPYLFIQNYALQSLNVPWTEYQVLILPSHTYKLRYSGVRLIKIVLHSNGRRYIANTEQQQTGEALNAVLSDQTQHKCSSDSAG